MTDPTTNNKAFAQPIRGSDSGTWDLPMNLNTTYLDALMGGGYAVAMTSTNVTLTQVQANHLYFNITGVLTANLTLSFPAIGGLFIINNGTTGAYTIVANTTASGSVGVTVPQSATSMVWLDGTNAYNALSNLPSGTNALFAQASAPAGWTQITTLNDYALRIVSGTGGGLTGTVGLSAFISGGTLTHALTTAELAAHSHSVTDPGHVHQAPNLQPFQFNVAAGGVSPGSYGYGLGFSSNTASSVTGITIQNSGSGTGHLHGLQDLKYVDIIVCQKV